ncbi:HNH endonuclease [[Mycoplasma] gypis]|uniref:HNH endonuclease signature motif containing protein n=1 Tax=[Mycoplasma] gypis TaxID=92404 RepID=A0ABZ2RRD1_9BACT|nr:HNH endonuclease signature motif containing protein [[Mycoplasma] gypis]MBN0919461.1 HNH endonuclease [[Mycoplasma] gypis]
MINWQFPYNSREWLKLRDSHLKRQPWCVVCFSTFNLQVDHIVEHRNRIDYFLNENNLQTLCARCHGLKSARFRQLKNLPNLINKKIIINLGVESGIMIEEDYFFYNAFNNFEGYENVYIFNFKNDFLDFKTFDLLCEFFKNFFIFFKFRTDNFNNKDLKEFFGSVVLY